MIFFALVLLECLTLENTPKFLKDLLALNDNTFVLVQSYTIQLS